ncbi:MAG: hypothetical protein EPO00_11780 [Chloroflexota bacterium]|nr:MAG: hypothetical protein EPO00_11780 [Chloroflexota bacterium]
MRKELSFRAAAAAVIGFAIAMAYLESAVVVYLQGALDGRVGEIFPLRPELAVGDYILIEVGREVATIVMIGAVGLLVGRSSLERLAWAAVVFGAWDIGYYAWLQVFSGWPGSLATTDLLFLIPLPWVGPVWSPIAVSVALVGAGLTAAARLHSGASLTVARRHWLAGLGGGFLVILSWTIDSGRLLDGTLPGPFPWPIFVIGLGLALAAAVDVFRTRAGTTRPQPIT